MAVLGFQNGDVGDKLKLSSEYVKENQSVKVNVSTNKDVDWAIYVIWGFENGLHAILIFSFTQL